jgi:hypothetical protein
MCWAQQPRANCLVITNSKQEQHKHKDKNEYIYDKAKWTVIQIIIQFNSIYLRAILTAQRPITKRARVEKKKYIHTNNIQKQDNNNNNNNNNNNSINTSKSKK